jgi:hypothetical protein
MTPDERFELMKQHYMQRIAGTPTGVISGSVLSIDDKPLVGVSVRVEDRTTVTDSFGRYSLPGIPVGNHVVTFDDPQYVLTQRPALVLPAYVPAVDVNLLARSAPQQLDADDGGVVSDGLLTLTFEPNDLAFLDGQPVHGKIDVMMTTVDPRMPSHIAAAPARLEGIDLGGNQVGLTSYGMAEIEVFQNGKQLQVRPGQSVTASMNISGLAPSVDSIPLWHHDTNLGLWVREPGVGGSFASGPRVGMAVVEQDLEGKLVATTQLPHFSRWNWDVTNGATCTTFAVQSKVILNAFRIVSTTPTGDLDDLWTMNAQCLPPRGNAASGYATTCIGDSPSGGAGFGGNTYFKYQAEVNGSTWCDLTVAVNGVPETIMEGEYINSWLTTYGYDDTNAWCGTPAPGSGVILGPVDLAYPPMLTPNRVSLTVVGSSCPMFIPTTGNDPGFAAIRMNALSSSWARDVDRDGVLEGADKCPSNSSSQTDTNNNRIGDACESWCNVPLTDPYSAYYDYDQDGVDDLCDNRYTTFNPSQYIAP